MRSILVFQIEFGKSKPRDSILNHHVFWNLHLKGRILERSLCLKVQKTMNARHQADGHCQIQACTRHGWNQCHLFHSRTIFCGAAFGLFVRSIQIIDFGNSFHIKIIKTTLRSGACGGSRLTWRCFSRSLTFPLFIENFATCSRFRHKWRKKDMIHNL